HVLDDLLGIDRVELPPELDRILGRDHMGRDDPRISARHHRIDRARIDVDHRVPQPARRLIHLVKQPAAHDEHVALHIRQEPREIALDRPMIERPRKLSRALVVREVIRLRDHGPAASATIRYSYAVGESAGTSGSDTAQRTSFANGAITSSGTYC